MSCADELRGLGEVRKVLNEKGGDIIAISTDTPDKLAAARKDNPKLPVILAGDPKGEAIRALHLEHESFGKIGKTLAVPSNILLDKDGVVRWAHFSTIVMDRVDPRRVLEKAQAV